MKVQDFAYQVAIRTIELLEETQHYKIPENLRKEIGRKSSTRSTNSSRSRAEPGARERSGAPGRPSARSGIPLAGKPGTSPGAVRRFSWH